MPEEGVYGENVAQGGLEDERGIREETVEAHPQPTGDAAADPTGVDAADEVRSRGAEAIEGSEGSTAQDIDAVQRGAAQNAGNGGGGRDETPRNAGDASQGEFPRDEDNEATTPWVAFSGEPPLRSTSRHESRAQLVLLHGYGSDERDMLGLAQALPREVEVVCLRAPGETENGGYAWFDISIDEGSFGFDEEGFQYAVALVLQEVAGWLREDLPLVMGGFSQGAMVAAAVTLIEPSVDAAWLMSGAFPPGLDMPPSPSRPVLAQHGTLDPVLPIAMGRDLAQRLSGAGLSVDAREYPVGHTVPADGLADGIEWFGSLTG